MLVTITACAAESRYFRAVCAAFKIEVAECTGNISVELASDNP